VTARSDNGSIVASWTIPLSTGGSGIQKYRATASPGNSSCLSTSTSCKILGLSNGVSYTVSVVAMNAFGASVASNSSEPIVPAPSLPDAPRGLDVFAERAGFVVSWTIPVSNHGSRIFEFTVNDNSGRVLCVTSFLRCWTGSWHPTQGGTVTVTARNSEGVSVSSSAFTPRWKKSKTHVKLA
jgi:hypothetical protein